MGFALIEQPPSRGKRGRGRGRGRRARDPVKTPGRTREERCLPELLARLKPGDLLLLTADHGCDPTWRGTDHTRERIPVIGTGPGIPATAIGVRATFADIGETLAAHLGLAPGRHGQGFL